jgi:hypothetical protein
LRPRAARAKVAFFAAEKEPFVARAASSGSGKVKNGALVAPEADGAGGTGGAESATGEAPAQAAPEASSPPEEPPEQAARMPPEPAPPVPPFPPAPPPKRWGRRALFLGFLGGALATGAAFAALLSLNPGLLLGVDSTPAPDLAPLADALSAQGGRLAALEESLAEFDARLAEAHPPDNEGLAEVQADLAVLSGAQSDLAERLAALNAGIAERLAAFAALDARLAALEARPASEPLTDVSVEALRAELEAERAEIDAMAGRVAARLAEAEAGADALKAEAEALARAARAEAALARLMTALDAGGPYAAPLTAWSEASGIAPPEALASLADTGVPMLAELRAAFPDAARAALAAALRAEADGAPGFFARIGAYLRAETGVRSLEPREGDGPDAVLSRAEAALGAGRLAEALALLAALPPEAQAELAAWRERAEAREAALSAAGALQAP